MLGRRKYHQVLNVLHKNWLLKRRSKCSTICEILVPLLVVGMLVLGYNLSPTSSVNANNYNDIRVWPNSTEDFYFTTNHTPDSLTKLLNRNNLTMPSSGTSLLQFMNGLIASDPKMAADILTQAVESFSSIVDLNAIVDDPLKQPLDSTMESIARNASYLADNFTKLLNNATDVANFQRVLCHTYGLCVGASAKSLDDILTPGNMAQILQGILPIIPFDAFVFIQKILERRVSDYVRRAQVFIPWISNAIKRRKLAFAPDTAEVRAMVKWLNKTTFFFNETYYGTFPTEEAAVEWARTEGEDQLWAVIAVHTVDPVQGVFNYSIRMNQTATPSTKSQISKFSRARGTSYQRYIINGFPSLQHLIEGYFLELVPGRPLGMACPVSGPGIDLEAPLGISSQSRALFADSTNSSKGLPTAWLADTLFSARSLVKLLPKNITDLIPGLIDPTTGDVPPEAADKLRRLIASPTTTTSLVFPVEDYDMNLFFTFASSFIGLVGVYAYLFPVSVTIRTVTQEKELKIKQGMLIMGLSPMCLYLGWLITNSIMASISAVLITMEMKLTFIKYAEVTLIFVLQLLFALSTVTFAFMCSTFFSKARNAAIVGPLILFVCTVPVFTITDDSSFAVRVIVALLSPVAYSWGMEQVAIYENIEVGITWNQIGEGEFSVGMAIVMLMFDMWLYLLLAWYFDQVLPSAFGVQQSPFFFLPKRFRNALRCKRAPAYERPTLVDSELVEQPILGPGTRVGIQVYNLRKIFKGIFKPKNVAVDGLTMKLYENQINVMLGHNGAGKTTTINMMTGILPPTSGDCLIYGRSIVTDMKAIRGSLGLCPQHDILWPKLSVAEHLRFYARLKGMDPADVEEAVRMTMHDIGLLDKAHAWSSTLSGGMKRRLSVGIALIGGSKVVFLDEPTSGMDPMARRQTWDLLRRAKAGRVVVLTTHFMDEADLLGDTIAIMSKGKLRCSGSPLFLKSRLGVGYNLSFDLAEHANRNVIQSTILQHTPSASVLSAVAGECQYRLPMSEADHFPQLFRKLEDSGAEWGILSFGLSLTTIEEVFLKVAQQCKEEEEEAGTATKERFFAHWRGELGDKLKRHKAIKQGSPLRGGEVHDGIPVGTTRVLELLQGTEDAEALSPGRFSDLPACPLVDLTVESGDVESNFFSPQSGENGLTNGSDQNGYIITPKSDAGLPDPLRDISDGSTQVEAANPIEDAPHQPEEEPSECGLHVKGKYVSGPQSFFSQIWVCIRKRFECAKRDSKNICLQILTPVLTITLALIVLSIPSPQKPPLEFTLDEFVLNNRIPEQLTRECGWSPEAAQWSTIPGYDIQKVENSAQLSNYSIQHYYDHAYPGYRVGGVVYKDTILYLQMGADLKNLPKLPSGIPGALMPKQLLTRVPVHSTTFMHNSTAAHAYPTMFLEVNKARLRGRFGSSSATIRLTNYPMPLTSRQQKEYNAIITVVAALFVLIPFTFFPANCVAFIVKEREVRAKHLQMLSGLRAAPYWISSYIFDNASMLITTSLTLMVFAIFNRKDVVGDAERFAGAVLLFVTYGLASIAMGYLCSFIFTNHAMAQNVLMIVNFLSGFVLVLASQVLNSLPQIRYTNEQMEKVYRLIPPYCLGEGIIRLSLKTVYEFQQGRKISPFEWNILGRDIVYMSIIAPVFLALVLFVDSSARRKLQHAFCKICSAIFRKCRCCCCQCCVDPDELVEPIELLVDEDEDVIHERQLVEEGDGREGDKVTIQHLRKTYPKKGNNPPKTAVHDLSLGVPCNEIFALLGSNGAGKTTTLSMMSGEFPPSSGRILLNGYNIQTQRRHAQSNIGYCPQFDAVLDHLSVEGHLKLYGRLRGIPPSKLKWVVDEIINYLGLGPHRHKSSMNLSGGNKRKLSIGMAVIGSPDVVFLDEPSSGLDPVSRRSLWTCISDLAVNRSIILTTHHLEEVDALAHRVTIMLHGRMRCIETLQHLKTKFGNGYSLQFRVPQDSQDELHEYLTGRWPSITLEEDNFGTVVYHLPSTSNGYTVKMSDIFGGIQKVASSMGIEDYSVSQTTLQDVFLRLTAEEEERMNGRPIEHDLPVDEEEEEVPLSGMAQSPPESYVGICVEGPSSPWAPTVPHPVTPITPGFPLHRNLRSPDFDASNPGV